MSFLRASYRGCHDHDSPPVSERENIICLWGRQRESTEREEISSARNPHQPCIFTFLLIICPAVSLFCATAQLFAALLRRGEILFLQKPHTLRFMLVLRPPADCDNFARHYHRSVNLYLHLQSCPFPVLNLAVCKTAFVRSNTCKSVWIFFTLKLSENQIIPGSHLYF